jgi:hypothetical protein
MLLLIREKEREALPFTDTVNRNDSIASVPIPAAARAKAWVCGRSLARIAGSNPAGGMDVSLVSFV